jgi:hypothetical protein
VSLGVHSRWSWQALALWAGQVLLALAIIAGLIVGPLAADVAWDRGVHVTPAQAGMHWALTADGFTHHHVAPQPGQPSGEPLPGPAVERAAPGLSWGTPVTPAVQLDLPAPFVAVTSSHLDDGQSPPSSADISPATPPPKLAA